MPGELTGDALEQLHSLLAQGRKLEAVKLYRELSGASLPEAMAWIDAQPDGLEVAAQAAKPRDLYFGEQTELRRILATEGEIAAIKYYRAQSGAGLFEAKQYVDSFLADPEETEQNLPPQELLDLSAKAASKYRRADSAMQLALLTAQFGEAQMLLARKLARRLFDRAYELADACRDGKIEQTKIKQQLARDCPGFGSEAYSDAIEEGFISSR